ncbi:hypothetical protein [Inconstantimicrobium mannanitabidum]|uniref:Uncharacterized protein n=1 Tax=Inconstantimicrobium mannanitabidum TaxID=1604901 RepID=A0ACB5R9I9_9CLOT|nr:hypothetical protein [Clostridium sp. TW13]GKX65849.1 hypothetical protein rsdtw13_11070 [Clostridium sp. TW13]
MRKYVLDLNKFKIPTIKFRFNEEIYDINPTITFRYLKFFSENKSKLTKKELGIKCITIGNPSIEVFIDNLTRGQIYFILNKFISLNGISKKTIKSYEQFYNEIESYSDLLLKETKIKCNQAINKSMKNIKKTIEQMDYINDNFAPIIAEFDLDEKIQLIFKEMCLKISHLSEQLVKIPENIRLILGEIGKYIPEYYKLLIDLGYPPVELNMPEIKYIVENKKDEEVYKIIDSFIVENYNDDFINEIFDKWEKYVFLKKRLQLFQDAIYVYNIEKYSLVIPLLLSQLEGVVAESFMINGKSRMGKYKEHIEKILETGSDNLSSNNQITKAYFIGNILEQFSFGDKIPKFSRHAILHGADVNYGTKVNCINLIITLDIIFECIDNMNKEMN